jgi:hypothetical protein
MRTSLTLRAGMDSDGYLRTELAICAIWYSALVCGLMGNFAVVPALHGVVFSLSSTFDNGEPMFGAAASAIYVWLTLNRTLAMPVFVCALIYAPCKTIVCKKAPKPTMTAITTLAAAAYLTVLTILEEMGDRVPHPLAKFFCAGGPELFGSMLVKHNGSFCGMLHLFARTAVTAYMVFVVPLSQSQQGQLCLFYIASVALAANIYDIHEAPALWWRRQMRLVVRAL